LFLKPDFRYSSSSFVS